MNIVLSVQTINPGLHHDADWDQFPPLTNVFQLLPITQEQHLPDNFSILLAKVITLVINKTNGDNKKRSDFLSSSTCSHFKRVELGEILDDFQGVIVQL